MMVAFKTEIVKTRWHTNYFGISNGALSPKSALLGRLPRIECKIVFLASLQLKYWSSSWNEMIIKLLMVAMSCAHKWSSDSPTEQVLYVLVGSGGGLSVLAWGFGALTSEQLAYPTAYHIAHLHFSALLADTGTHLRVCVDNDCQEHVLEKYRGQ